MEKIANATNDQTHKSKSKRRKGRNIASILPGIPTLHRGTISWIAQTHWILLSAWWLAQQLQNCVRVRNAVKPSIEVA